MHILKVCHHQKLKNINANYKVLLIKQIMENKTYKFSCSKVSKTFYENNQLITYNV